jgi:UDP-N-acetyl-D-glucosamine dehydrogenase
MEVGGENMISKSPFGDKYTYSVDRFDEDHKIEHFVNERKTIVVQGLGFVGSAMIAALANARDANKEILYNVIGIDLPDEKNFWKIGRVNDGKPPILSTDRNIDAAYRNALKNQNVFATYSEYAYSKAETVVIDINLDAYKKTVRSPFEYYFTFDCFEGAMETIANNVPGDVLCVVETTVPPGTTENVVYPIFQEAFKKRHLDIGQLSLAHSYERVMPGVNYLNSITNFYRVYSGINNRSAEKARKFFESFVNTEEYPLCELNSPTASEIAKVLENSYRAMNIAFIQEWTEYAEKAKVDLFQVINAIRMRPTHRNIMLPGFGVGGYCLSKDPLLADYSYRNFFNGKTHLKMSLSAVEVNDMMPNYTYYLLKQEVPFLRNMHITILGVSYLNDVADTRYSPTEVFYDKCTKEGAVVTLHDPLVSFWQEKSLEIDTNVHHLKKKKHDAAIFAVRHGAYLNLTSDDIVSLLPGVKVIIDANNIINDDTAKLLSTRGIRMKGVGKGHWENF